METTSQRGAAHRPACCQLRRCSLILLAAILLAVLPLSCSRPIPSHFPTLWTTETGATTISQPSGSQPTQGTAKERLVVAMPISSEALEAVRLLYLAKSSGMLKQEPGQYIGHQISPEDLRPFDKPFEITLLPVSLTAGATLLQISAWQASATLPDIIYCQDALTSLGLDQIAPLDDSLYANPLLAANHIYASVLESGRVDRRLFGIPYLVSTPLILLNQNLLSQLQLTGPKYDWTWQDWHVLIQQAQKAIIDAGFAATPDVLGAMVTEAGEPDTAAIADALSKALFVTDNPADLLPYLPLAADPEAGYATWGGRTFNFQSAAFRQSVQSLAAASQPWLSLLNLTPEHQETAFGSHPLRDSRSTGRVLMWTADSSELSAWQQKPGLKVSERLLPGGPLWDPGLSSSAAATTGEYEFSMGPLPVTVRSLFISKTSRKLDLAADFAAFAALDADSLLLQSRYQLYEGLLPAIQDHMVWNTCVSRQLLGNRLAAARDRMPDALCSGQQIVADWQERIAVLTEDLGPKMIADEQLTQFNDLLVELIERTRRP